MAPLRIAVFVNRLPPMGPEGVIQDGERFGGVQRACWSLSRALARRGHDVWVFAAGQGDRDVAMGGSWHVRLVPASGRVGLAPLAWRLFVAPGAALGERRPDVVLAYMGDPPAPQAAARWARKWRVPLMVSYHGDPVHGFGSPVRRLAVRTSEALLTPRVLRRSRAVVALSPSAAESSRVLASVRGKVHVVPNGVDAPPVGTAPDQATARRAMGLDADMPIVLFVGSLTPIKGVDVLLEAFARMPDKVVRLHLVGAGPHRARYEDQAVRLGLAGRVTFHGFVTELEKADLLRAADVLAMPSRSEAFPLTLLEAGLAGLPAVASRLPALEAMVDEGRSGRLVPVGDVGALAGALGSLLADNALRRRMGAAAQAWASGFTWQEVARQTEALLREVQAGGPAAPGVKPGREAAAPGPGSPRPRR